jgi:DNA-binding NtrC family response regulator
MSNPRVLVLDDDPGVRRSLERFLKLYGYQAVAVASLDAATDALKDGDIQALVLDVRLEGGATGLELLRMVRQRREFDKAPILVMTGGVLSDAEEASITRHRAFLFYKPEGYDSVVKFLDTLTGRDQEH